MDKIFEALLKLVPFAGIFENLGMEKELSVIVSGIINIGLVVSLTALVKYLAARYKDCKTAKDLAPDFDYLKVKTARELFISTQFQNQSPGREEEPGFSYKFVSKSLLIPFFINIAFNEKKESNKFYLVLADSGMGKTTFMINLYAQYTSFFNIKKKYRIRLFIFSDERILDRIREIEPDVARNTILLLDAFDEYKKLIPPDEQDGIIDEERFRSRMDEIIEAVRDFREVVITSRTQYFPGQEHEPYELAIPRSDDKGFNILAKLYLSPFDNKEIKKYLRKKYGLLRFWNRKKKKIAATIVKNSPKLMVRPMLLAYIDLLVDKNHLFKTRYEIYETLLHKWISREADKHKHKRKLEDREKFGRDLHVFSRLVALELFRHRKQKNQLSLAKDTAIEISNKNNLDLRGYEITGKSLLTRDAEGNWKFAHKSIFEFLIAREVAEDPVSWKSETFEDMDMTEQFILEKCPHFYFSDYFIFIKGGTFLMGSPDNEADRAGDETLHEVKVDDFYMAKFTITEELFEVYNTASKKNPDKDKTTILNILNNEEQKGNQHPVVNVCWNEAIEFCKWLSKILNVTFRLPTEAEWEYACRAGTTTPFNTGENLTTDQANYDGNHPYKNYPKGKTIGKTRPVGSYPPNSWGLYEMHGNVWEWCMDWYGENYYNECKAQEIKDNPEGPEKGSLRVMRGGGWGGYARRCRSAHRLSWDPGSRNRSVGFRLVFVP